MLCVIDQTTVTLLGPRWCIVKFQRTLQVLFQIAYSNIFKRMTILLSYLKTVSTNFIDHDLDLYQS